ncbi:MAG: TPM domain-containing protein [Desulfuromonadaceae bacterium]|nr:TPM domain-containing protein [Desulfuromonadaceae bacterium]
MRDLLQKITIILFAALFGVGLLLSGCGPKDSPVGAVVDDPAGVLTAEACQRLIDQAQSLLVTQHIALQLFISDTPVGDIDQLAVERFNQARLGAQTGGARGVLLVFDPCSEQVRMEIGYDLESVFTDLFIARIEQDQMAPFFAAGRVADGIEATMELLVSQVLAQEPDPVAVGSRPMADAALSGGGGARSRVPVGSGLPEKAPVADGESFSAQATPLATLACYRLSLQRHIKDPNLGIYTPETKRFFAQWLVTDAQQDNALRDLERCWALAEVKEDDSGTLAVIRFPVDQRSSAPYLLRRSPEGWQLDFATMNRVLGFNQRNQWRMRAFDHPFLFAFADWSFDRHGFPFTTPSPVRQ